MLKSLLVAMDETPGSEAARRVAFALARETGACLAGFGNLDVAALTAPAAVPLGGTHCKTACKSFQIPGVNSVQKFPPRIMRSSSI